MIRKRALFTELIRWLDSNKIIIIKGARQVGKTTLLLYLKDHLTALGKRTVYISADDLMFKNVFDSPSRFFQYLKFEHHVEKDVHILIDEFQYIKDAGLFIKVLYDTAKRENKNITFVVSGSSSLEISKNRESLTGRKVEFTLFPFSLTEALAEEKKYAVTFDIYSEFNDLINFYSIYKDEIEGELVNFLRWGGYPEVYLEADLFKKKTIFKEIISSYLEKDIAGFLRISNISAFNNMIKVLAGQIGNLVNKNELSNSLGLNYKTVEHYLDILKGTYIFSYVTPFFTNVRKELTRMPKVYIHDTGIYYYYYGLDITFDTLEGKVIENFVFNTLRNRYDDGIYFYRTKDKTEIDFIIKNEKQFTPIEVKFRKKISIPSSLLNFIDKFGTDTGIVITKDTIEKRDNVFCIPVTMLPFCSLTPAAKRSAR
ncbi:MAG: AAA family ATPase [Candidatus Aminicenantes bacterium]|nr:AAA family ATPase [Candidatus Aminicenantes bacterium]NIM81759.1 AAA family ATPase [Candidatus Aminicenantes bacterium]NIN21131.1 AAA family ATPase [Candidatus Aminicenantes bacterium]NIN44953.1 AAA family ATPase [Candidatus Aminicenantes bacterium]NIN87767.1 AAA family ATPase [Candidatus Aminicenantes bacterium]